MENAHYIIICQRMRYASGQSVALRAWQPDGPAGPWWLDDAGATLRGLAGEHAHLGDVTVRASCAGGAAIEAVDGAIGMECDPTVPLFDQADAVAQVCVVVDERVRDAALSALDCRACGGSGGGAAENACRACGGTGRGAGFLPREIRLHMSLSGGVSTYVATTEGSPR